MNFEDIARSKVGIKSFSILRLLFVFSVVRHGSFSYFYGEFHKTNMSSSKKVKSALISVFHKDGLEPIVKRLNELGVTLFSTGGTEKFIRDLGIEVVPVEELTSYPSILGGRVKTLHPKVFGGILGRRENDGDLEQLQTYEIPR